MNRAKLKELALDLAHDLVGSFLYAASIQVFILNARIATCGISGLAISINHIFPVLPIGALTLALNVPLMFLSYHLLGRKFFVKSIRSMVLVSLIIDLVGPMLPQYTGDRLISALLGGALMGLGLVTVYMRGSSTGGADFLIMSLKKLYPHISTGTISMLSDAVIISIGAAVFRDIDSFLYGAVSVYMVGAAIDKVSFGLSSGKLLMVVTERGDSVAKAISRVTERGSTIAEIKGAYTNRKKQMVISAMSKGQVYRARRAAHDADTECFIMISPTDDVYGEGFKDPH